MGDRNAFAAPHPREAAEETPLLPDAASHDHVIFPTMVDDANRWSTLAVEYNDTAAHLTRRVARVAFDSVAGAIPGTGSTIIDTACGTGALTDIAAEHFATNSGTTIIACDFAEGMVRHAANNAASNGWTHVRSEVMDAQALDLPDDMCQAAFCIAGVLCMENGQKAVKEMHRILAPGGSICFSTWKSMAGVELAIESFKSMQWVTEASSSHQTPWHDREWLQQFATEAGFTDVRIQELAVDFHVPDAKLLEFGNALQKNPVFSRLAQGMSKSQQQQWPQALADAARRLYGGKDVYDFENVALIVNGKKI